MKSLKKALTFENMERLFNQRLVPISIQIVSLNTKVVGIYGELDSIKQQILDSSNNLEAKIETHRKETKDGFDTLFEAVTNLNDDVDKDIKPRLKRLENKVFAC